jgi:hypothetical protein
MRTRCLAAVVTVGIMVLAITALAHAAPPPPPPPAQDSVTGSGTFGFFSPGDCCFPFAINVRSGPSGEQPSGQVTLLVSFGAPSCLAVRGPGGPPTGRAAMNLLNPITGQRVILQIDETELGDLISFSAASSPNDCAFRVGPAQGAVASGDIVIADAPPMPTSTEQCKNGGWRSFPDFTNQGSCVSFVATGGKSSPPRP